MSVYTNFLKLRKPDETEKYTVNHFNANADLIDSALARMEQKNVSQDNLLASKASLAEHINNHSNPHNISKSQIGLDHVENKSSSDIRNEITESNVTTALGYTPCTPNEVDNKLASLKTEINSKQHTHNNKTVLDGITSALITAWNTVTNKVDKVAGKGLSSNDYTTEEKNKLNRIEPGANVNVQADWNVSDTTSDAYIKNKPNLAAYSPSVMTGATANAAGTSGIVPAPAKGKHRAYLRGDGTWQATSTSLTATTPGVPLDHTAAKTLKDQIDAQNSNLSELNANLQNLFVTKVITKSVTVQYLQIFSIPVSAQDGYRALGVTGFSIDYRLNLFGIGLKSANEISAMLSSRDGTNITVSCSFYVLYVKNFS